MSNEHCYRRYGIVRGTIQLTLGRAGSGVVVVVPDGPEDAPPATPLALHSVQMPLPANLDPETSYEFLFKDDHPNVPEYYTDSLYYRQRGVGHAYPILSYQLLGIRESGRDGVDNHPYVWFFDDRYGAIHALYWLNFKAGNPIPAIGTVEWESMFNYHPHEGREQVAGRSLGERTCLELANISGYLEGMLGDRILLRIAGPRATIGPHHVYSAHFFCTLPAGQTPELKLGKHYSAFVGLDHPVESYWDTSLTRSTDDVYLQGYRVYGIVDEDVTHVDLGNGLNVTWVMLDEEALVNAFRAVDFHSGSFVGLPAPSTPRDAG